MMDISCILLTWNSEAYIDHCLTSLLDSLKHTSLTYEIRIVDNGSQDQTVELLTGFQTKFPDHIFPLLLDHNTGTTYSRNLALKRASGEFLCVMDSDVEVPPGVFSHLIMTLKNHPSAGLVAPKLVYPSGQFQKSTDQFPTITRKLERYLFLKQIEQREHSHQATLPNSAAAVTPVDYVISAMWVFRRKLLERVGLLDEKIFYAPEDVDYCLRIWKAGYTILYDPRVTCIHHTQEISRGWKLNRALIEHIKGLWYYFKKHGYWFNKPGGWT